MTPRKPLLFALLLSALPWTALRAADDAETKAVEVVTEFGGIVVRDNTAEGKPVREVDLGGPSTDEVLKAVGACKQLQRLNAAHCRDITDAGLRALAGCKQLQWVDLEGCIQVTDAGLKALAACKQLQYLNLRGCFKVTDTGLKELATCQQLKDLNLGKCEAVSDTGLKQLATCHNSRR